MGTAPGRARARLRTSPSGGRSESRSMAGDGRAALPEALVTYRGAVYPTECDHMGHMNVAFYVAKFDQATWQLFAAMGLTPSRLRAEKLGMAGVEQHIEYKRELFAGDVVTVTSRILEVREKAMRFAHEM